MTELTRLDSELDFLSWMMLTHNVYLNLRKGILPTGGEVEKMLRSGDYNFQNPSKPFFIKHPTSKEHRKELNRHVKYCRDSIKNTKKRIDDLIRFNQQDDCYDTYLEFKEIESRNR